MVQTIAILGKGVWGTALATLVSPGDRVVRMWSRRGPDTLDEIVADADIIVCALSVKGVTETARKLQSIGLKDEAIIVTATKGLDPETARTPSQIWEQLFPGHPIVVLSGPNLSREIVDGCPAATVVASRDRAASQTVQAIFSSDRFRVYTNDDPLGTELGGTLKNVIAIAAGVCDGLHLGTNAKSALLCRAIVEMIRVGTRLGAQAETFWGLAGLGDLLATCNSSLSRNYRVGYALSQGKTLEETLEKLQSTAEGVNTTNVLIRLARQKQIEIPISSQVYRLLNSEITPQEAVAALMERELKPESDSTPRSQNKNAVFGND